MGRGPAYSNANWQYTARCVFCREEVAGTNAELTAWRSNALCSERPDGKHYGASFPVMMDKGSYRCRSCNMAYGRIAGGNSTTELCDQCVSQGRTPKAKSSPTRGGELPCGETISHGHHLNGRYASHWRKNFWRKGEDWACPIPKSTYNTLDGSESSACGKQATQHVVMPAHVVLPSSADSGRCGVVCDKHAAWLVGQGAKATAAP